MLTGIGVERSVGSWGVPRSIVFFGDWLPECPHFGSQPGPGMRAVLYFENFNVFVEKMFVMSFAKRV